jgi:hypothetical protein
MAVSANFASAQALSGMWVNNVCSAQAGCETLSQNQYQTALRHGGSWVEVYVWEIGFGNSHVSRQGGNQLTNQYLVAQNLVCRSGNTYTINCTPGQAGVGWRYVWNVAFYLNNNYGTLFTSTNRTGMNPPFNTQINIQK